METYARTFGITSVVLGLLALLSGLAREVAMADLGADLGINGTGFRIAFFVGSLALAVAGGAGAILALIFGRSAGERFGLPLPGLALSVFAILWSFL
ncbi:MAG TPA: hypothetical protein VF950_17525 [Planctomycetota bacterium]